MALERGVIGYSLYLEFRRSDMTAQYLFTPPFTDRDTKQLVQPFTYARNIGPSKPRAKWRWRRTDVPALGESTIEKIPSMDDAASAVSPILDQIILHLKNSTKLGWEIVGEPLIVEMTERDGVAIRDREKIEALLRRVTAARKDADYPTNLFEASTEEADLSDDE